MTNLQLCSSPMSLFSFSASVKFNAARSLLFCRAVVTIVFSCTPHCCQAMHAELECNFVPTSTADFVDTEKIMPNVIIDSTNLQELSGSSFILLPHGTQCTCLQVLNGFGQTLAFCGHVLSFECCCFALIFKLLQVCLQCVCRLIS
jgi:hypothetical protein